MAQDKSIIQPRTLKGFRDYLPEMMLPREELIATARRIYRSYGFSPIDTPCLEYEEILLGKGSDETDKQTYRFEDHGGRRVALRFDLTVPLARFSAQHAGKLGTPFKRYHIGPVWRGENTQRGRYREFVQCDFDTIGTESVAADIEAGLVIYDLLRALGFARMRIRVNHRGVLNGLLDTLGAQEQSTEVLRAIDRLDKVGPEKVAADLQESAGLDAAQAGKVLELAGLSGGHDHVLTRLESIVGGSEVGQAGVARLREITAGVASAGVPDDVFQLDVSIARGLDYYTGVVFETQLTDLPGIGSVCSGGRYDNLAELYTKQRLPGIGASLGLDRLLSAMEELGLVEKRSTPAEVFLAYFDKEHFGDYLRLAAQLRAGGLAVELYPEPKKLGNQLKYADRRGFPLAVIVGASEWEAGRCQLKDLRSGESEEVGLENEAASLIEAVRRRLSSSSSS